MQHLIFYIFNDVLNWQIFWLSNLFVHRAWKYHTDATSMKVMNLVWMMPAISNKPSQCILGIIRIKWLIKKRMVTWCKHVAALRMIIAITSYDRKQGYNQWLLSSSISVSYFLHYWLIIDAVWSIKFQKMWQKCQSVFPNNQDDVFKFLYLSTSKDIQFTIRTEKPLNIHI